MNTAASTSTNDAPLPCASAGKGVWYKVTPNATGSVTVTSCGSDFDTVLGVYSGSCNSLAPIDCNDDSGCAAGGSTVVFAAVAGTT